MQNMNFFYQLEFEKRKKDNKRLGVLAVIMIVVLFLYPAIKFYDIMGLEYEIEELKVQLEESKVKDLEIEYMIHKNAFDSIKMAVDRNELMDLVVNEADYITPDLIDDIYSCFDGEVKMKNIIIANNIISLNAESKDREEIYFLMHKIRNLDKFTDVRLANITQNDESSNKRFDLTFRLKGVGPIVEVE